MENFEKNFYAFAKFSDTALIILQQFFQNGFRIVVVNELKAHEYLNENFIDHDFIKVTSLNDIIKKIEKAVTEDNHEVIAYFGMQQIISFEQLDIISNIRLNY